MLLDQLVTMSKLVVVKVPELVPVMVVMVSPGGVGAWGLGVMM